ncbi:hypothetical protein RH831_04460 [Halodesulfurarchaeum sp. HSR-GB]|uniref:hypothetical protein n=1 Tax=Halodesulfurarchaeum sp. HSR-GB TaxID=3074077 RepID=UPI0028659CC8|nr:hypothetical protein [Halodesulfurarchaeum sp. HSR-GB]MDR5656432.1 hypothetical protein [Halodesulfurarchaeum sp. HSR-GB]
MSTVSTRQYRWLDRLTKLGGVALLAGALETGIATAPGLALALAGVLLGGCTAICTEATS